MTKYRNIARSGATRAWIFATALPLAFVLASDVHAVSVSPAAVYIDHQTRTGQLTLRNTSSRPEEIEISFAFGYPRSDADGRVRVDILDEAPQGDLSAVGFLRAFPRRLVLQPGERQVVRILAEPPSDLADGEYWGRVLVRSRGGTPPIEGRQDGIDMQISIETVVVVAVTYRKGNLHTGVELTDASTELNDDGVMVDLSLERTGTAAYLGRAVVEVFDRDGVVLAMREETLAVYRDIFRRILVPEPEGGFERPPARVRIRLDTERPDLPRHGPLPAAVVTRTLSLDA